MIQIARFLVLGAVEGGSSSTEVETTSVTEGEISGSDLTSGEGSRIFMEFNG